MTTLLLCIVFVALAVTAFLMDRRRRARLRADHAQTHNELSDVEFLKTLSVPESECQGAITVRHALGEAIGVPAGTIHPSDRLDHLLSFGGFDGGDFWDLIFPIENALRVKISSRHWDAYLKGPGLHNVASLIHFLEQHGHLSNSTSAIAPPPKPS